MTARYDKYPKKDIVVAKLVWSILHSELATPYLLYTRIPLLLQNTSSVPLYEDTPSTAHILPQ